MSSPALLIGCENTVKLPLRVQGEVLLGIASSPHCSSQATTRMEAPFG